MGSNTEKKKETVHKSNVSSKECVKKDGGEVARTSFGLDTLWKTTTGIPHERMVPGRRQRESTLSVTQLLLVR